jgi:ribosome biogenesis protein NSA2
MRLIWRTKTNPKGIKKKNKAKKKKVWKKMVTKITFADKNFTRKAPKLENFIRPYGLRFKKVNVTHPELKTTFKLLLSLYKKLIVDFFSLL